ESELPPATRINRSRHRALAPDDPLRQCLDPDVPEPDRLAFGLPADRASGGLGLLAPGDLDAVQYGNDRAALAGHLQLIPLADGFDGRLLGERVALCPELGGPDGEDRPGVGLGELDLDAVGPDLVRAGDVDEEAAIAPKLGVGLEPFGPVVPIFERQDII